MDIYQFNEGEILVFILMLIRVASFWLSWPLFSGEAVPQFIKILVVLAITIALFPLVKSQAPYFVGKLATNDIILYAARETFLGVIMGFLCRIFFFILTMVGQMVVNAIGFSQGNMFNPSLGMSGGSLEQFYVILGTLFFLTIRGHHYLLTGLVESFRLVPFSESFVQPSILLHFSELMVEMLKIAFQISAPVVVTLFFLNFALGILGKAVPQINVLVTSFPLNILVGLFVIILSLPLLFAQMEFVAKETVGHIFSFLKGF